jgi:hypothetical protein
VRLRSADENSGGREIFEVEKRPPFPIAGTAVFLLLGIAFAQRAKTEMKERREIQPQETITRTHRIFEFSNNRNKQEILKSL